VADLVVLVEMVERVSKSLLLDLQHLLALEH
jgi:hypothetical protein